MLPEFLTCPSDLERYVLGLSTPFSSIAFMHQSIYMIDASMISLSLYIHSITIMLTRMYQSVKKLDVAFGVIEHMIQFCQTTHVMIFSTASSRHSCELGGWSWSKVVVSVCYLLTIVTESLCCRPWVAIDRVEIGNRGGRLMPCVITATASSWKLRTSKR
jgi:hypothetical protein